jgi:hypothetical protein
MKVSAIFKFGSSPEIRALHLTWIAFFICFYVWFNMAPLAIEHAQERRLADPRRHPAVRHRQRGADHSRHASSSAWRWTASARAGCSLC